MQNLKVKDYDLLDIPPQEDISLDLVTELLNLVMEIESKTIIVQVKDLKIHPLHSEIYSSSDIEDLKENIVKTGLLVTIVVDKEYNIISGHLRFRAIKELGWKEVEVKVLNIKDEAGSYIVSFNKQRVKTASEQLKEIKILKKHYGNNQGKRNDLNGNNTGQTTRDKISKDLNIPRTRVDRLQFIDKIDPDLVKYIDKFLTVDDAYRACKRKEKSEQNKSITTTKLPNTIHNEFQLYNSSSSSMTELEDESIQTIFTSPPYWKKRNYQNGPNELGSEDTPQEYVDNLVSHLKDCKRVLNKKGSFFLNIGDTFHNMRLQLIPERVVIKLTDEGWILRNKIIWKKKHPHPSGSHTNLTPSYEFIFHLVKNKDYFYNEVKVPHLPNAKPSKGIINMDLKGNIHPSVNPYIPSSEGKNMGDYWDYDTVIAATNKKGGHPAAFPLDIVTLPIKQTSVDGDTILDPFMGSGTTGMVALGMNRNFVGYDVNQSYIETANKKLLEVTSAKSGRS